MEIVFQGKTYRFGDTDWTSYFTELREMVAMDMWQPMFQDKPIPYRKVDDVDIEAFMAKYFIREVNRDDLVGMLVEELKRRAKVFEPLRAFDNDAYEFAIIQLAETFCQYRLSFFEARTYCDTFNEWLDKFTFIRLEDRKTDEPIYFQCDFSKAEFDVDTYLRNERSELFVDVLDAFDKKSLAEEIETMFWREFNNI